MGQTKPVHTLSRLFSFLFLFSFSLVGVATTHSITDKIAGYSTHPPQLSNSILLAFSDDEDEEYDDDEEYNDDDSQNWNATEEDDEGDSDWDDEGDDVEYDDDEYNDEYNDED